MPVTKPYKRTCRQFGSGDYGLTRPSYIEDPRFATAPQQYVRAFAVIQKDLLELFDYIEPADKNRECYSYRILELLLRTCVEVEANCKAILTENAYNGSDWTMKDYKKLNATHRLSSYKVKFPVWHGSHSERTPFTDWAANKSPGWYRAYNEAKHNRQDKFEQANFNNLLDAVAGLVALLASQFFTHDFSLRPEPLIDDVHEQRLGDYSIAIGDYFLIKFPNDWPAADRYYFDWEKLKKDDPAPFQTLQF